MLSDSFLNFLNANTGGTFGVAVSGGSDSMALLQVMVEAAKDARVTLCAATVDHGLRDGSAQEAGYVAQVCDGLDVPHDVLVWEGGPDGGNLQDAARQARYGLLADWAKRHGLVGVAVGHTADDQAETFLMRLARGAGVDGLSGMASTMRRDGVSFYRPLLGRTRAELRSYLEKIPQDWVEDPSNQDVRFERVKARHVLSALSALDIGVDTLTQVSAQMSAASAALQGLTMRNIMALAELEQGDVTFDWRAFCNLGFEEARRFVLAVANGVAPSAYPPRRAEQQNLIQAVRRQQTVTLHGCLWSCNHETIRVTREFDAVRQTACASDDIWDHRWAFEGPYAPDLELRAMGEGGLKLCPDWRGSKMPRASVMASPAVWRGEELVAAPLAGMPNGWCARLTRSREQFLSSLLSH